MSKPSSARKMSHQTSTDGTELIGDFLQSIRQRLGLRALLQVTVWTTLVAGSVMLLIAMSYVLRGHSVDRQWYLWVAVLGVVAGVIAAFTRRASVDGAATFADHFFGLKDLLITCLHAGRSGRSDGFYALQAEQAADRVQQLDPQAIDCRPPRRQLWLAIAIASLSLLLAFKQPSEAVQTQLDLETTMLVETERMNQELEDLVDELEKSSDDEEERELLDPDRLREMVEELRKTKDYKEALRQYAKLEQQLEKARHKLEQRRDEQLLARAAKELEKAEETKSLAERLQQKKFQEAGEQLSKWKPTESKPWNQQRRELARLKAAAQRMAAAARNSRQGTSSSHNPNSASKQSASVSAAGKSSGGSGQASGTASSDGGGDLAEAIEQLAESLKEWDEALEECASQEKREGQCDAKSAGQCKACASSANSNLSKLSKYLRKMTIKRRANQKLSKLCKACSQCQGGLGQCAGNGPNPGGKKAGWGSNESRRDVREELYDNGQTASLTGIKGQGPSQTTVESADEGTGVSTRRTVERERQFRRQFESFVSREDVPAEVKSGVKRYFQFIHQIDETQPTLTDSAE